MGIKRGKLKKKIELLWEKLREDSPSFKSFLFCNFFLFCLPGGFITPFLYSSLIVSKKVGEITL